MEVPNKDIVFSPSRLQEAMGGMSMVDLAEKLGCAKSNISMYLSGQRNPTKMTIQLMAICLNVNPAWLMGLDVPKYLDKKNVEASGPTTPLDRELVELLPLLTEDQKQLLLAQIKVALGSK
mgnify:FL=1